MARLSPASEASRTLRRSLLMPEIPNRPDFLFITSLISSGVKPSCSIRNVTIAGSMAPQRVPIIRPSSGVKPIVVSTGTPWSTAVMEQPLPRWQVIRRISLKSSPRIAAARSHR